jgi:hypothetical protein
MGRPTRSSILERNAIIRILDHLGLPSSLPTIAPARLAAAIKYCQAE